MAQVMTQVMAQAMPQKRPPGMAHGVAHGVTNHGRSAHGEELSGGERAPPQAQLKSACAPDAASPGKSASTPGHRRSASDPPSGAQPCGYNLWGGGAACAQPVWGPDVQNASKSWGGIISAAAPTACLSTSANLVPNTPAAHLASAMDSVASGPCMPSAELLPKEMDKAYPHAPLGGCSPTHGCERGSRPPSGGAQRPNSGGCARTNSGAVLCAGSAESMLLPQPSSGGTAAGLQAPTRMAPGLSTLGMGMLQPSAYDASVVHPSARAHASPLSNQQMSMRRDPPQLPMQVPMMMPLKPHMLPHAPSQPFVARAAEGHAQAAQMPMPALSQAVQTAAQLHPSTSGLLSYGNGLAAPFQAAQRALPSQPRMPPMSMNNSQPLPLQPSQSLPQQAQRIQQLQQQMQQVQQQMQQQMQQRIQQMQQQLQQQMQQQQQQQQAPLSVAAHTMATLQQQQQQTLPPPPPPPPLPPPIAGGSAFFYGGDGPMCGSLQGQSKAASSWMQQSNWMVQAARSLNVPHAAHGAHAAHSLHSAHSALPAHASRGALQPGKPADAARADDVVGKDFRQSKELAMSPKTRAVYKDFSHTLRSKDTQLKGERFARDLAQRCMRELPETVHWRVHLEMADLSKREKNFSEARRLYRLATELQPSAPQTWLEYAKMEEERGHFDRCQRILTAGLHHCPYHEALMLKGIKHLERMGELRMARSLLSQLYSVPINQSWRTLLEGALLEARAGQTDTARRIFKFLLQQAPWYGPVWHEACRFEQRCNHMQEALHVAESGLVQLPRYGPLWFCALRLHECTASKGDLLRATRQLVERGVRHISKDLVWKLWFESAQVEERNGNLQRARAAYVKSVATCAANLRWKVWLGGARTELCHSQFAVSQALLEQAYKESPPKTRAIVMLEQSRLHELCGNAEQSRKLLRGARKTNRQEWKVFLESVLLELRSQDMQRALKEAHQALKVHRGTGRLWAVLIQLEHAHGVRRQLGVFQQALLEVPKSGEVWCEGARICLNPFSECFNLKAAHNFLDFAIEFTPQYGDSFIEYLRLQMLMKAPEEEIERLWQLCINAEPNYGTLWFHCKSSVLLTTRQVMQGATELLQRELREYRHVYESAVKRAETAEFSQAASAAVAAALGEGGGESALPPLRVEGSVVAEAADFVTGSVTLNRMHRRLDELSFEEKRSLIYGGDMIVP